jgi:hypothetical protein
MCCAALAAQLNRLQTSGGENFGAAIAAANELVIEAESSGSAQ